MPTSTRTPRPDSRIASISPPFDEAGEGTWVDVIHKMEEVYSDLIEYESALEEKNAELEETHQFLYSVLSAMSDIVAVCDRFGIMQEANHALSLLTGKKENELRGMSFVDLLADEHSRTLGALFPTRIREGDIHDCEVLFHDAEGHEVPVSLNCTPRFGPQGLPVGMVIVGRPVGELRRAYQSLQDTHEKLKSTQRQLLQSEKMASLGRLVAGVAHELNNPISFVLGNVHALDRYADRLKQYLGNVHHCNMGYCDDLRRELKIDKIIKDLSPLIEGTIEGAERTREIVDGLKRFSAPDSGDRTTLNLAEIVDKAVHWVTRAAPSSFRVTCQYPQEMWIEGTEGQIQQVIINLVQNALDATASQPAPHLEITGEAGAGECALRFHDNGHGIKPENLTRVFDPFFTTKQVGKGTGLGLSITYGIVEHHHGQLTAANHPDGGALFTLVLPNKLK